jgi:parallel beta-helix repeat protein
MKSSPSKGKTMKTKMFAIGIILLFVGTCIIPANAQDTEKILSTSRGNIIYVDDDNTEGPWDGTLEHPYKIIQEGVNNSHNGDTVYVFAGNYSSLIMINNSINLVGENKQNTIISSDIEIKTDLVNITSFTLMNKTADWGLRAIYLNCVSYCNISNNIFDLPYVHAIDFYGPDDGYIIIMNNTFEHFNEAIQLDGSKGNNIVKNNKFIENNEGIYISSDSNIVENNNFSYQTNCGVVVSGNNNIIQKNIFYSNEYRGIYCWEGQNKINYNNFIKNKYNAEFYYFHFYTKNNWNYNFWDDNDGRERYPIKGIWYLFIIDLGYGVSFGFKFHWRNFDWHPAQEPYDIGG